MNKLHGKLFTIVLNYVQKNKDPKKPGLTDKELLTILQGLDTGDDFTDFRSLHASINNDSFTSTRVSKKKLEKAILILVAQSTNMFTI